MKPNYIFVLIFILLAINTSFAQDDDILPPWQIVERCIEEAIQPPDDWAFDGTIIADGWAGIHGMNASWDTPRVLAFWDDWIETGGFGTLSPDGRWYAIPQGNYTPSSVYMMEAYIGVTHLLIYDMTDRQNVLRLEWRDMYELYYGVSRFGNWRTPVWYDQDTFVYRRGETYYHIDVPNLEVTQWNEVATWTEILPLATRITHPSPDWSRIVANLTLFDTETTEFIADIYEPSNFYDRPNIGWHPDSTEFVISGGTSTQIVDKEGNLIELISTATDSGFNNTQIRGNSYSPDGTMLWLTLHPEVPSFNEPYTIGIANRTERVIWDTCLNNQWRAHFSPDSRYLALLSIANGQQELQILDIENWQLYRTSIYHDGVIIGWRADD